MGRAFRRRLGSLPSSVLSFCTSISLTFSSASRSTSPHWLRPCPAFPHLCAACTFSTSGSCLFVAWSATFLAHFTFVLFSSGFFFEYINIYLLRITSFYLSIYLFSFWTAFILGYSGDTPAYRSGLELQRPPRFSSRKPHQHRTNSRSRTRVAPCFFHHE